MSKSDEPKFLPTALRIIRVKVQPLVSKKLMLLVEGAAGVLVWSIFKMLGFEEAIKSDWLGKLIPVAAGAIVAIVIHISWTIGTINWRLYCELQKQFEELASTLNESQDRMQAIELAPKAGAPGPEETRLEIERLKLAAAEKKHDEDWHHFITVKTALQQRVNNAPVGAGEAPRIAWYAGVEKLLERTVIRSHWQDFYQFTQAHRSGDVVHAKEILWAIANSLTPDKMKAD